MKWINVKQGSPEWFDARLGIPTASNFHRIVTPSKLTASSQAEKYLCELVAERMLMSPVVDVKSLYMERGTALEQTARAGYEFEHGITTAACGLAVTDDGRVGASPDCTAGEYGLLEIKCPAAHTHIRYLLFGLEDEYRLQLQGQLWVTGRRFVDFRSECPGLPPFEMHVQAAVDVQGALGRALPTFCDAVDAAHEKLQSMMSNQEVANG